MTLKLKKLKLHSSNVPQYRRYTRSRFGNFFYFLFLTAFGLFSVFPLYYSIITSFKPINELLIFPPNLFYVQRPTIENYLDIPALLSNLDVPLSRYIFNSVFVCLVTTFLNVIFSSMAAFVLSKGTIKYSWKRNPEDYKLIAFTFDDAPDADTARQTKIVDTLNKYAGAGTFFVTGYNLRQYTTDGYKTLQYAVNNGFEIGNHTNWHKSATDLANVTATDYYNEEIAKVNSLVSSNIKMADGETPYEMNFIRASNLYLNDSIMKASEDCDMPLIGHKVSSGEMDNSVDNDTYIRNLINNAADGDIVLMHAWSDKSADSLEAVLKALYARGYRFVTLSEMFEYKLGITDFSKVDVAASCTGLGGIGCIGNVVLHS